MSVLVVVKAVEEAPLLRWGARFAQALELPLRVLYVSRSAKRTESGDLSLAEAAASDGPVLSMVGTTLQELLDSAAGGDSQPPEGGAAPVLAAPIEIRLRRALYPQASDAVLSELQREEAELLLVSKVREGSERWTGNLARRVLTRAPCQVMIMRASSKSGLSCERILVPTAGGPHARQGLKLAAAMASGTTRVKPAHFVEEEMGEEAEGLGMRTLLRALKAAGIAADDKIVPEVLVGEDLAGALGSLADESDLMILGAHDGMLPRVLWGDLPERLLGGERAGAAALIRRAKPSHKRTLELARRTLLRLVPQLEREQRLELFENLQQGSRWSLDFMALIGVSTAIASLGLLQGSTAVVIGAMLVAPLMTPMIGAGLALIQGNALLARNASKAILLGLLTALLISGFFGLIVPTPQLSPELLARGSPTLLDLGIALFSGVAAAYALARPGLTGALPGVAIAAALVPPLCTIGIAMARGEMQLGEGAALLFGTNLVAIILGAALVFRAMGVHGRKEGNRVLWVRRVVLSLSLVTVVLSAPLGFYLYKQLAVQQGNRVRISDNALLRVERQVESLHHLSLVSLSTTAGADTDVVNLVVASGEQEPERVTKELAELVRTTLRRNVSVHVTCLRASYSEMVEPAAQR